MWNSTMFPALACVAALTLGGACATSSPLAPTTLNPASVGKVSARQGPNDNTKLTISVEHLPPPQALDPSLDTFVAWIKPIDSDEFLNVGQLQIDDDRSGKLQTTTPFQKFTVLVTAETEAPVRAPSDHVILQGDFERQPSLLERLNVGS